MPRAVAVIGLLIVAVAGLKLISLESQAGNTIAEAFYNQMGWLGIGIGVLMLAVFLVAEARQRPRDSFSGPAGECPNCHQFISREARSCPYCQTRFATTAGPPSTEGQ